MTDAENPSNSSSIDQNDDLKLIRGIGPETANALNRIGVRQFSGLAQYTPKSLSDALHDQANFKVAAKQIKDENWINQAKELAQREREERQQTDEEAPREAEVVQEMPIRQVAGDVTNPERWQQHASFTVYFETQIPDQEAKTWQIRIFHHELKEEAKLPGKATTPWLSWMLEQVAKTWQRVLHYETKEEAKPPETDILPWISWIEQLQLTIAPQPGPIKTQSQSQALDSIHLEILDFSLSESELSSVHSKHEKKLSADFRIRLSGTEARHLTDSHNLFQISIYIVNMKDKSLKRVAFSEEEELKSNQFEYKVHQEFPMPDSGNYECYIIAQLLPPYPLMFPSYRHSFNVT